MKQTIDQIILAPMEGVLDPLMRNLLTRINPYDLCITEFIRIVDSLLPHRVFTRVNPELLNKGYTPAGTPIRVQLLGQHPQWMAENAVRAVELGSHGLDLNFGCPAKTVNKNRGGAALLKSPETIYQIVSTVKEALGSEVDLSVKIRLGFEDSSLFNEIVGAIDLAKADLLTIHARTKKHGYKPPAYWEFIKHAKQLTNMPIVANGEVWNRETAMQCLASSQATHLMLGRGALSLPNIADVIKNNSAEMSWQTLCLFLQQYSELELQGDKSYYFSSRLKQWLRYLRLQYKEADEMFTQVKRLKNKDDILAIINHAAL